MGDSINPNDLWSHAISLDAKKSDMDLRADFTFMKDLFYNKLPIGESTENLDKYFNELEQVIFTKDGSKHIQYDQFPDEPPNPDIPRPDYKYFSPSVLKIRSSGHPQLTNQQNVESPAVLDAEGVSSQDQSQMSQSLPRVPECPEGTDLDILEQRVFECGDNDF